MPLNEDLVELRGDCPSSTVAVLDAVSAHLKISRTKLVNRVLGEWAERKVHESSLVMRLAADHPALMESNRKRTENKNE